MLKTIHDVIKDIFKTASDVDLHKNRQERCHPLGWQYELPKSPIDKFL